MNKSPTLLVLAAGMGSRYGGLKQLEPMGPHGETIIDYSVYDARRAGFRKIIFVIRQAFAKAFRERMSTRLPADLEVAYACQELRDLPNGYQPLPEREKPWGTGHAIYAARHLLDGPFAVINADDFYGAPAFDLLADKLQYSRPGDQLCLHMVGYSLKKTLSEHGSVNRGVCTASKGKLLSVEEYTDIKKDLDGHIQGLNSREEPQGLDPESIVSMNFWGFPASVLPILEQCFVQFLDGHGRELKSEFYIPAFVDSLIGEGRVECRILPTQSEWFGVTYPEDKPQFQKWLQARIDTGDYPSPLS